ncbi:sugar transferase [Streptomyces sp. NPDC048305]|uniref:sugar transferase n=1 Tax=Streptomyces sp. NPDC048305 TaxID=3365532 RepID=UPI0037172617
MRNAKQTAARRTRHTRLARLARLSATRAAPGLGRLTGNLAAPGVKRSLDVTLGATLLLLVTPALAVAALALTLRPPLARGNAVARETRIGLGGRPFELRSLRTRRLRLDLLSRLPHVVRGDLSLVGPPPLTPGEAALLSPSEERRRQALRPGLTGLAQVRARSGMPWDEPALLDAHYAEHHGTWLDLAILAQSVRIPLQAALRGLRHPGKAHLSDTDHRLPGYSAAE